MITFTRPAAPWLPGRLARPVVLAPRRDRAVTAPDAVGAAIPDEGELRAADLMLARVADARVLMAASTPARVMLLAMVVVQAMTGVWVRGHVPPSWPLVAAGLAVTALGVMLPRLARRQCEPRWADAARAHALSLEGRVPLTCLNIAAWHARVTGQQARRDAFLYIPRCVQPGLPHLGACHLGGVLPLHGRLLVVLGEHLAAGPPHLVAGVLGHEVRHVTGWRFPVTYLRMVLSVAGPFLLGWAVPWPALPAALAGFIAVMTAVAWVTEISCDLGSARAGGTSSILGALDYLHEVIALDRSAAPVWKRYAASTLTWITGPPHPPFPVRRALIRLLARRSGDRPEWGWVA